MAINEGAVNNSTRSAVIAIICTVFALALGDAVIKGQSTSFTLWQIFFLRSMVVVPILIVVLKMTRWRTCLKPVSFRWTVLRSLMLTLMWVTYYVSLTHITLPVAAASYYTLPLFISIFAAVFLGDTIGRLGWLAIVLGFVGVVMVVQPRVEEFNWYAVLPVCSAILYALAMILTRSRCKTENVFVLSLWLNISMLVVGSIATLILVLFPQSPTVVTGQEFLLGTWVEMSTPEWATVGVLSIAILIGSTGAAYAYQNGAPATIATFDIAYVAFALFWSIVLFQETPSVGSIIGMLLIVFAGVLAVNSKSDGT